MTRPDGSSLVVPTLTQFLPGDVYGVAEGDQSVQTRACRVRKERRVTGTAGGAAGGLMRCEWSRW